MDMASIRKEISIAVPPEQLWDAMRDLGALHTRLVAGFVVDCRLEGESRTVTFANGMVATELIVDLNDADRRVAWSAAGGRLTHHNASAQVFDDADGNSRVVWIADLLPHEMATAIAGMIEQGLAAMKQTLEKAASPT
jgi:carbon monoxide dehydrogenase subunit G